MFNDMDISRRNPFLEKASKDTVVSLPDECGFRGNSGIRTRKETIEPDV